MLYILYQSERKYLCTSLINKRPGRHTEKHRKMRQGERSSQRKDIFCYYCGWPFLGLTRAGLYGLYGEFCSICQSFKAPHCMAFCNTYVMMQVKCKPMQRLHQSEFHCHWEKVHNNNNKIEPSSSSSSMQCPTATLQRLTLFSACWLTLTWTTGSLIHVLDLFARM